MSRVVRSPDVDCPVEYCQRPAGLCCVNERGAVRRGGPHPERLALEQQQEACLLPVVNLGRLTVCGFCRTAVPAGETAFSICWDTDACLANCDAHEVADEALGVA